MRPDSDREQRSAENAQKKAFPLNQHNATPVTDDYRDTVEAHVSDGTGPAIVSISDIHGYLDGARSALLALTDHPEYAPIVEQDNTGALHWAGNDYVLVFNGDLVDRGPKNMETVQLVARLIDEAPNGRVRITLGNHDMAILTQDLFSWEQWYSGQVDLDGRRALIEGIRDGHVVAANEGYTATYAHAGYETAYDVSTVNTRLVTAAERLHRNIGSSDDYTTQKAIVDDYPIVLGMGRRHLKHPPAGLVWLGLEYLPEDAPPQIVGHTRQITVTQKGTVLCENVIRNNIDSPGGEAVVVETPISVVSLRRTESGDVQQTSYNLGS